MCAGAQPSEEIPHGSGTECSAGARATRLGLQWSAGDGKSPISMHLKRMSRRASRGVRALLCLMALGAAPACGRAHSELYVSAEDSGEVLVVDADRGEVTAHIAVGKRPRGMKLSHDGKLLYVALSGSPRGGPGVDESKLPPPDRSADGIGVIELGSRKLLRTLPSGQDPEAPRVEIAISCREILARAFRGRPSGPPRNHPSGRHGLVLGLPAPAALHGLRGPGTARG